MASAQSSPSTADALLTPLERQPATTSSSEPQDVPALQSPRPPTKNPKKPPSLARPIIVYSRRHILALSASPLVQRPEGMPALKDWFGDWGEQHNFSQAKRDATETSGSTGNRRFPRRDQEDGGDSPARPSFRSTLSQPSQMGNFKHQSLRSDLTRGGDRDKDTDRDKEGLRNLSDMYDRDRLALPLALPPIIRSQQRDATSHPGSSIGGGTSSSGRVGGREPRADRESGRRGDNGRRKGGESVDWRRGADAPRGGKEDIKKSERGGSPEVERSRRDRSASREKLPDRTETRGESRRDRGRDRENDERDKEGEKGRRESRREDGHQERRERFSERVRDSERGDERRKGRDEGDKDDRRKEREKAREHPDTRRDRELREGLTIGEERAPGVSSSSRRMGGRRGDEEREGRRDRDREKDKDKEPAWMDDYVPETGAPKAGIFGGKVEGMEDEIQTWKKKQQQTAKVAAAPSSVQSTEPVTDAARRDSAIVSLGAQPSQSSSSTNDEQAKAADAFILGLMKGDGSKSLSHTTTPAKSPEPAHTTSSAKKSPASDVAPSSTTGLRKVDPAVVSVASLGISKPEASVIISPSTGGLNDIRDTTQSVTTSVPRSSPGPLSSTSSGFSSNPGQLGSSALNTESSPGKPVATLASTQFNPPQQSRVLAFSQSSQSRVTAGVIGQPASSNRTQPSPLNSETVGNRSGIQNPDNINFRSTFSPFDTTSSAFSSSESNTLVSSRQLGDARSTFGEGMAPERNPRLSPQILLSGPNYEGGPNASTYAAAKGSRFAKFWDGKPKDALSQGFTPTPGASNNAPPPPPQSVSPSVPQQQRQSEPGSVNGLPGNVSNADNIQDMLTFLQNSQASRVVAQTGIHRQHPSHLQALHEAQIPHHQPQPQHHFSNALENHQFENRPFVPDGLVPGLRPARNRDSSLYNTDHLEDSAFTVQQRLPPLQQPPPFERPQIPQLYSNQIPGIGLGGVAGTNRGFSQPPFRVDTNTMNGPGQQRLPPGLANLGGRPPHDPNGYINLGGVGLAMQGSGAAGHQQAFNQFGGNLGANAGFGGPGLPGGAQQQRGPVPMQLLSNANALAASGHPEFTVQPHHPLLRGPPPRSMPGGGFGTPGTGPIQQPLGIRQPQQGPHMLPQMMPPPHMQQQQQGMSLLGGGQPQTQNEHLLSMLMGGLGPRE